MRIESSLFPAASQSRSAVWVLMLAYLWCPASAVAQVTGTISGYVQDQGGGVVPGATVTAESSGQQLVRSAQTNAGRVLRPPGAAARTLHGQGRDCSGFETQVQKDVELTAGANVRLDFSLERRRPLRGGRRRRARHDAREPHPPRNRT